MKMLPQAWKYLSFRLDRARNRLWSKQPYNRYCDLQISFWKSRGYIRWTSYTIFAKNIGRINDSADEYFSIVPEAQLLNKNTTTVNISGNDYPAYTLVYSQSIFDDEKDRVITAEKGIRRYSIYFSISWEQSEYVSRLSTNNSANDRVIWVN